MKKLFTVLICTVFLFFAACGGGGEQAESKSPGKSASPEELGQKTASSYLETLKQVVAMLNDRLPAEELRAMLTDLKNWTIELMVGLGREREALSPEARAEVDRVIRIGISRVPPDLFSQYQEGQAHYRGDSELFRLIADFNIITQYANFDLLKKQAPAEAARLGIE